MSHIVVSLKSSCNAFVILDKPQGLSSQSAVTRVRKILQVAKAGHTGTLDPLATGVLPIALGEATKAIPFLQEDLKVYEVTAKFGEVTDTDDADGKVLETRPCNSLDISRLQNILAEFSGVIEQLPPLYSAIKVKGRKLYQYARQGREVEIPRRQVTIFKSEILKVDASQSLVQLRIDCSPGTYIRSLVRDLGEKMGCGAHVSALKRIQSGLFHLSQSVSLEDLKNNPNLASYLSIETCLAHLPQVELLSAEEVQRVRSGVLLWRIQGELKERALQGDITIVFEGLIVAIVGVDSEGKASFRKVFSS